MAVKTKTEINAKFIGSALSAQNEKVSGIKNGIVFDFFVASAAHSSVFLAIVVVFIIFWVVQGGAKKPSAFCIEISAKMIKKNNHVNDALH